MFEGLLLMDKLLCAPFPSEQNSEVRRHILYCTKSTNSTISCTTNMIILNKQDTAKE